MINLTVNNINNDKISYTENAILIIGPGENEYKNKEIYKPLSLDNMYYCYGNSNLTTAYTEAINIGAKEVFVCNCYKDTDYIDIIDLIAKYDFSYIVPLFNFSEQFTDKNGITQNISYYYSESLSNKLTQLFFTDKHASLYDDINSYLIDMTNKSYYFNSNYKNLLTYGENIIFCLNVLSEYQYSNVVLASIFSNCDWTTYPNKDVGEVYFDIETSDLLNQEIVYFQFNNLTNTTIENLYNYKKDISAEKYIPINIVKQKICRALDFNDLSGQLYSPYLQIMLQNRINLIMNKFVGNIIQSYSLNNLSFDFNKDNTIKIYIDLSFTPNVSIEQINIKMEI